MLVAPEFARRVRAERPDERRFRRLALAYVRRYQETYWFEELEPAIAALERVDADPGRLGEADGAARAEVEVALAEYCLSLNEVAAAVDRLLDARPMTADDLLSCVAHVWEAYACNEGASGFAAREDAALCDMLVRRPAPACRP
jgi:hypothetical protein